MKTAAQASQILSQPFWWITKWASRIVMPIKPKQYGQHSSKTWEISSRILAAFTIPVIFPISLPLKFTAEIITALFHPKNCLYKDHHPKKPTTKATNTLSILNWNICGLPGGLPTFFGGVAPFDKRVQEIAKFILKQDCDIICLQEAHDVNATKILSNTLKNRYRHVYTNIGSKGFQHNSGLIVLSKKMLSNTKFTPFSFKGKQFGVNKGMFSFEVDNYKIITTHLQPYTDKKDQNIRLKELELCLKELNTTHQTKILCGDLNIDRYKGEPALKLIKKKFIDPLGKIQTATDALNGLLWNKKPATTPESVDYCLLQSNTSKIQSSLVEVFDHDTPEKALSDHHAIVSVISKK